ncbi:MAG: GNAT family N-acetyltransferase [Daejeonella sp.]
MIEIREYRPEDKNLVMELFRLNTPDYFSEDEEADLDLYLDKYREDYYVLYFDNQLVGSGGINYEEEGEKAIISWDIFHPEYHGKGLGTKLLKYRIDKILRQKTANNVLVRTSQVVYKFYQKFGFRLVETQKDFWAEGFDLYKMEYLLPTKT